MIDFCQPDAEEPIITITMTRLSAAKVDLYTIHHPCFAITGISLNSPTIRGMGDRPRYDGKFSENGRNEILHRVRACFASSALMRDGNGSALRRESKLYLTACTTRVRGMNVVLAWPGYSQKTPGTY